MSAIESPGTPTTLPEHHVDAAELLEENSRLRAQVTKLTGLLEQAQAEARTATAKAGA